MKKTIHTLLHCLLAAAVFLSLTAGAVGLSVPKAAEHEDAEVTFGEPAGAPPKPATKAARQPPLKAAEQPAAKGNKPSVAKGAKGARQPAATKATARSTAARQQPATKTTAKSTPARPSSAVKAAPSRTAPAKSAGKTGKKT